MSKDIIEIFSVVLLCIFAFFLSFLILNKTYLYGALSRDAAYIVYSNCFFLEESKIALGFAGTSGLGLIPLPFYLFGCNNFALRFTQSIFLSSAVLITYFFTRKFYNRKSALIASIMLVFSPLFLVNYPVEYSFFPALFMLILLLFYTYWNRNRKIFFFMGCVVLGFAISLKLIFIYLAILIPLSKFLVDFFCGGKIKFPKKLFGAGFIFLLLGLHPLIIANFSHEFGTVNYLERNLVSTSQGHQNLALLANFNSRIQSLNKIIIGGSPILAFAFILLLSYLVLSGTKKDYFLLLIFLLFVPISIFVPTQIRSEHFLPIYPVFIILLGRSLSKSDKRILIAVLLIFMLINIPRIGDIYMKARREQVLINRLPELKRYNSINITLLRNLSSQESIEMSAKAYLRRYSPRQSGIVLMPKKIKRSEEDCEKSQFLKNSCQLRNFMNRSLREEYGKRSNKTLYVFSREIFNGNTIDVFKKEARKLNKDVKIESLIRDSQGKLIYKIYTLS